MTTREQLIQEIQRVPESQLDKVLEFVRSLGRVDSVETALSQLWERGEYADDVPAEELAAHDAIVQDYRAGRDRGIPLEDLELELFGRSLD